MGLGVSIILYCLKKIDFILFSIGDLDVVWFGGTRESDCIVKGAILKAVRNEMSIESTNKKETTT